MAAPTEDRVLTTISAHAASMLAVARTHSLCHDDALDAYQRATELYLRKVDGVRDATAGEWLRTVAKNEAIRLRDQRRRFVGEAAGWELRSDPDARDPDERAVAMERVAHAAEALQSCKRDESTAILLKAGGASYADISARTGWSATKVNRVMSEGRRAFLERFADIEAGAACERYAPLLSAVADGEATPEDYVALRPHLRHCVGCRGTLRGLYDAQPALGSLVPAGVVAVGTGAADPAAAAELPVRLVARLYEGLLTGLGDRLIRAQAMLEAVTASKAGVVAATAAVAAGGAAAVGGAPPAIPDGGPAIARTVGGPATPIPTATAAGRAAAQRGAGGRREARRPDAGRERTAPRRAAARDRDRRAGSPGRSTAGGRRTGGGGSRTDTAPAAPAATPAPAATAAPAAPVNTPSAATPTRPTTDGAADFGFEG